MSFQTRSQRDSTFQSTHPRGVRLVRGLSKAAIQQVSIHAPAWGATAPVLDVARIQRLVSIHAPAWGATVPELHQHAGLAVSIHAPAWGATSPSRRCYCLEKQVSIHAPAWGATSASPASLRSRAWFQSTHPRGVRRGHHHQAGRAAGVSIHAPAWGATPQDRLTHGLSHVSIHAPAWGATFCRLRIQSHIKGFNPRTRVGCDDKVPVIGCLVARFNPRTRVGCDRLRRRTGFRFSEVSIHAPAWGATFRLVIS